MSSRMEMSSRVADEKQAILVLVGQIAAVTAMVLAMICVRPLITVSGG